jgi:hypothetical protein
MMQIVREREREREREIVPGRICWEENHDDVYFK